MQDRLERNKEIARRALGVVINQHRPEALEQFDPAKFRDHSIFWNLPPD